MNFPRIACPRSSLILFTLWALLVTPFMVGSALGVRSSEYYEERAEASLIKGVAVVEEVRVLEETAQSTRKEVLFRLEQSFGKEVPHRFRGICFSVDRKRQEPNAGGTIYYYPEKGVRALVTVRSDGGTITSYTPLSDELEQELRQNGIRNIGFHMGRAVTRKERWGLEEQWFTFYLEGRPSGYLHVTASRDNDSAGTIRFQHEFLVGEQDGERQLYVITTRARDGEILTPEKLSIEKRDISPEKSASAPMLEVVFRESAGDEIQGGILQRQRQEGSEVAIPPGITTDFLLFEWMTRQPFGGPALRLNLIETLELHLKKGVDLVYCGRDPKKERLHRFELRGPVAGAYWLNDRHELIEVLWDTDKLFKRSSGENAQTMLQ